MNNNIKNRIIWVAGAFVVLCVSWILCRFAFFDLHGNKQWLMLLFIVGLIALAISAMKDARKVMACIVIGYIGGFALGVVFGIDGLDQGGGATNNWWQIWIVAYLAFIIAGVLWEVISKRIKSRK